MTRPDAIGGYFGLELPDGSRERYPSALRFQSARAAFLALLRAGRPERVWMPWFICDSMIEPVHMANIPVVRYGLDSDFKILDAAPGANDWLLYVNYFGLSSEAVTDTLGRFPRDRVIIDCAQAFFAGPFDCLATIYSPRKFLGVADGGYLVTKLDINLPDDLDDSIERSRHLLIRTAHGAEAGYAAFGQAEESLVKQEPRRMSHLTEKLLTAIDYDTIIKRRRENFRILQASLQSSNLLQPTLTADTVPLCYPYRSKDASLRSKLIRQRVFIATYWPDVLDENTLAPEHEQDLARSILPLPCDQRYNETDMQRILNVFKQMDILS